MTEENPLADNKTVSVEEKLLQIFCDKLNKEPAEGHSIWIIKIGDGYTEHPYEVEISSTFSIHMVAAFIRALFRIVK